MVGSAGI